VSTPSGSAQPSNPSLDGAYEEWIGQVVDGRYRVDGLLGEGGMGAVFVAEHLKLRKKVAIKVIHPEFAGDGDVAERFFREAMTAAQLEHPHIASATDYGTLPGGGGYLVMQYVEGGSLRDALDEGALGWLRACEIGAQIADALAAAHAKGFVHRDLKPDNVMLQPRDDGTRFVKVLDFGIARVASDSAILGDRRALTRVGTVIGTPGYMAPEQALGEPVDARADIYALGLLLHEMVTGTAVYDRLELTAIVTRQLTESPPRLSEIVKDAAIPPELDDLVRQMLERERDKRTQSASEVREALRQLLLGATVQAVASGEHELPKIAATALLGAADRETPLGVALAKKKIDTPVGTAPTMAATPAARQPRPTPPYSISNSLEQLTQQIGKSPIPIGFAALGCIPLAVILIAVVIVGVASSDPETSELRKEEHLRPRVEAPREEPEPPAVREEIHVPPALAQPMSDLMNSEERRDRREAARLVLAHEPAAAVPPFLHAVAQIENASNCRRKKEWVARIVEIGDARAIPALERLEAEPRNGCRRFIRTYDCLSCLRDDIEPALAALRARME
jgi:eukaryotic-like serine/threonine-protein kinase